MTPVSIEQVLACPTLPTLPTVAMEVLALTGKPNVNLEEIASVVQHDQALTARILKTINSSFYALPTPCPTITRAIALLGLSTVKSLVLGFSLVDSSRASEDGFDLNDYWRRNLHAAAATRCIVKRSGTCDPEEAFIAALMLDIGMPAIFQVIGRGYHEIIARTEGDHNRLVTQEQESLGFHHAEVGARMAQRWHLPDEIIEAIRRHHAPGTATSHKNLVQAVSLGSMAAAVVTETSGEAVKPQYLAKAAEWFGIDAATAQAILGEVAREAKELSRLFRINVSGKQAPSIYTMLAEAEELSFKNQLSAQRETAVLRERNKNLTRMAVTDALTGVGNRKQFDTVLETTFATAHREGDCLGLLMVDADKFKALNDMHGHQVGDAVLVELARRMMECVGDSGVICRYGGEEFAVIMAGADRRATARIAETVRVAIASTPIDIADGEGSLKQLPVTVSIGVCALEPQIAHQIVSHPLLVRAADRALYAAKEAGRNCVRVFTVQPVASKTAGAPTPGREGNAGALKTPAPTGR